MLTVKKNNNAVMDNFSLMAVASHIRYNHHELQKSHLYYQNHFLESIPTWNKNDQHITFIVQDGTDLLLFAKSAALFWKFSSKYPHCFKGTVRTRKGNCFATFNYLAEKNADVMMEVQ
ncbi:hypothetical protein [Pedobacter sp. KLB.chiD]|uniref:hypothetical protein n=1 Tax=Pedobacter sp. KLB.chiD TaxID=3387402 RepID=UPI00399B94C5